MYVDILLLILLLCSLSDHLGSGQFGTVSKGVWHSPSGDVEVAVKSLQASSSEEERVKFLQEAAIMGQFKHPNIITIFGVSLDDPVSCPTGNQCSPMISSITS